MSNIKSLDALNKYVSGNLGKNLLINGDFSVWQRGESFGSISDFTADRLYVSTGGSNTLKSLDVPPNTVFSSSFQTSTPQAFNPIELQEVGLGGVFNIGQILTFSLWLKHTGSFTVHTYFRDGVNDSVNLVEVDTRALPSGSGVWTKYEYSYTINASPNPTNQALVIQFAGGGAEYNMTGIQLELGDTATDFEVVDPATQLARCQRYYWRGGIAGRGVSYRYGLLDTANAHAGSLAFPSKMRIAPTPVVITAPTYVNCSTVGFFTTEDGYELTVTKDGSTGTYRALDGVYEMDAEIY